MMGKEAIQNAFHEEEISGDARVQFISMARKCAIAVQSDQVREIGNDIPASEVAVISPNHDILASEDFSPSVRYSQIGQAVGFGEIP